MSGATVFATIGVVGAGAYGAALALAAARAGRRVVLWARDERTVEAIEQTRQAPRLPGALLPDGIRATASLTDLGEARALVLAAPTQALRQLCEALALALPPGRPVISAAKGIEQASGLFTTDVIADAWPGAVPAILSGPSFATDIGLGLPTAVTLAAQDPFLARALAQALSSAAFRIYHSGDARGVEIGGAAKNVL
ncbi:MAG: NAD(P)-binding domain-containing protein, partial [Bosea sp. (in: a-proteobacteria)]